MPTKMAVRPSAQFARQRVLEAAILRFSHRSYKATRPRDIAANVRGDVALVHRSFDAKEGLSTAVVSASIAETCWSRASTLPEDILRLCLDDDRAAGRMASGPLS